MSTSSYEAERDLGAAFLGFTAGSILFGITILQAFQYFTTYVGDSRSRKQFVALICFLDTLHSSISTYMMYTMLVNPTGDPTSGFAVVWSFKAVGTIQTVVVILVQSFYLYQIWRLTGNFIINRNFSRFVKVSVWTVFCYAIAMGAVFLVHLEKVKTILSFGGGFQNIIYLGLGSTAFVDCGIAIIMSSTLYMSGTKTKRSEDIIKTLILYFVGTGVLTAIAAIIALILYTVRPNTLLYLSVEFSIIRLYANSILALLREKMNATVELRMPSALLFGEPIENGNESAV
ncbi:hypothetical protein B0H34DRAFT_122446 [Crassisporium funariophilum]|nr:hypothetical protein B0H34DRAFT_122446 [Crassisporium funariophilum]